MSDATAQLIKELRCEDPATRRKAAYSLSVPESEGWLALTELIEMLRLPYVGGDPDTGVRLQVAWTCGKIGIPRALEPQLRDSGFHDSKRSMFPLMPEDWSELSIMYLLGKFGDMDSALSYLKQPGEFRTDLSDAWIDFLISVVSVSNLEDALSRFCSRLLKGLRFEGNDFETNDAQLARQRYLMLIKLLGARMAGGKLLMSKLEQKLGPVHTWEPILPECSTNTIVHLLGTDNSG